MKLITLLFSILILAACGDSDVGSVGRDSGEKQSVKTAAINNTVADIKTNNTKPGHFENVICADSARFSALSDADKEKCYKNISKLCDGVDQGVVTNWLPTKVPSNYIKYVGAISTNCLLYTSPSPRDATLSRMPSSA